MSQTQSPHRPDSFIRRLGELRQEIEQLPEAQRAQLRAAADAAERQHRQMEETCQELNRLLDQLPERVAQTIQAGCKKAARSG